MKNQVSRYQPKGDVLERHKAAQFDYQTADSIRNRSWEEFNNRDLITYMNDNQRAFNSYVPSPSDDPEQAWRANTVRPLTRNKCISVAAHVTAAVLFPNIVAQNLDDEEDRDAAIVMKDLMDFSWQDSEYEKTFVYAVISALFNPAVIIEDGYAEVMRKVKEMKEDGSYELKEMLDEVYSGFYNNLVPPDELYIGNMYEHDVQKQPFLIRRRVIEYSDARIKYGDVEAFNKYVKPGVKFLYSDEQQVFYEAYDDNLQERQVEEVIYYNRFSDLELRFINGVLIDDPERPMQRADKLYPFAKTGFEPIDEGRFFYYKPLTDKIALDQGLVDVLYNLAIDATFLQTMPPAVLFGDEEINSSVVVPGKVTPLNEGSNFMPLNPGTNMNAALTMLQKMEQSADESSAGPLVSGNQPIGGTPTAFQISTMQQNAMRVMGLFGKMVKFLVEDFGKLRLNTSLQFLTVGEAQETMSGIAQLKFRSVMVPKDAEGGRKKSKKVEFSLDLPETKEMQEKESFGILKREQETEMEIARVNPHLFRQLKYKVRVEADMLFANSETVRKAMNLEAYDRLIQNPHADTEAVTRDFLIGNYRPGEEEKYMKQTEQGPPIAGGEQPGTGIAGMVLKQAGARQPTV